MKNFVEFTEFLGNLFNEEADVSTLEGINNIRIKYTR